MPVLFLFYSSRWIHFPCSDGRRRKYIHALPHEEKPCTTNPPSDNSCPVSIFPVLPYRHGQADTADCLPRFPPVPARKGCALRAALNQLPSGVPVKDGRNCTDTTAGGRGLSHPSRNSGKCNWQANDRGCRGSQYIFSPASIPENICNNIERIFPLVVSWFPHLYA